MTPNPKRLANRCLVLAIVGLLASWLPSPPPALAESKTVIAEGTYTMGDGETPLVAEARALQNAKRAAVEQVGTYVQSFSKTQNFQLTDDELLTIAGAVIETQVLERKRTVVAGGLLFYVKIKATVTTDNILALADRAKQKGQAPSEDLLGQYKALQANYDRIAGEIDNLKRQLSQATSRKEQEQTAAKLVEQEARYLAVDLTEKGYEVLSKQGNYAAALDYFSQAIKLDPTYDRPYFWRATIYEAEPATFGQAIADYAEAIRRTQDPWYYYKRGQAYLKAGQAALAIDDLSTAIRVAGTSTWSEWFYLARGIAYSQTGHYELAASDFTAGMELLRLNDWPGFLIADRLDLRAHAYEKLGRPEKAIEDYSQSIRIAPSSYAYTSRGMLYHDSGKYKQAFDDFTEAIRLERAGGPRNSQLQFLNVLLLRAKSALALGLMEQVVSDATEALRENHANREAYWLRGTAREQLSQLELAIQDLSEAIRLEPTDVRYYVKRSVVYAKLGRYDNAILDTTSVIGLESDEPESHRALGYEFRGWLRMKLNHNDLAMQDLSESIRLNPRSEKSYRLRGDIHMIQGNWQSALSDFQKACALGDKETCGMLNKAR